MSRTRPFSRQDAIAVELHLVEPLVPGRRIRHRRGELGVNDGGQRRLARARNVGRAHGHGGRARPSGLDPRPGRRRQLPGLLLRDLDLPDPGIPDPVAIGGDLLHAAPGGDALRPRFGDVVAGTHEVVLLLDEEPRLLGFAGVPPLDLHEGEPAGQLLAFQTELEAALAQARMGVLDRLPRPVVPEQDGAAAVLALRDDPLEVAVFDRVVFGHHREALVLGIEAGALGHRPALEDAFHLQAEVVMEPGGGVLLDDEGPAFARLLLAAGLGSDRKVALVVVLLQPHAAARLLASMLSSGSGWQGPCS